VLLGPREAKPHGGDHRHRLRHYIADVVDTADGRARRFRRVGIMAFGRDPWVVGGGPADRRALGGLDPRLQFLGASGARPVSPCRVRLLAFGWFVCRIACPPGGRIRALPGARANQVEGAALNCCDKATQGGRADAGFGFHGN